MLKKLAIGAFAVVLGSWFLFGREAKSFWHAGIENVKDAVRAEIPLEFELERARHAVTELLPEIKDCLRTVAEQQVECEGLGNAIAERETVVQQQREQILALRKDLATEKPMLVYNGRSYTAELVQRDLALRFERFKSAELALDSDRKVLAAREQTLVAHHRKLETLLRAKQELEVKLEQLQARLQTLRAAEAVSQVAIDESGLNQARQLIQQLNGQLEVRERMLQHEQRYATLLPLGDSLPSAGALPAGTVPTKSAAPLDVANVVHEVDAYFQEPKAVAATEPAAAP